MHLYHYLHYKKIPSVVKHGLSHRFRKESWSDTSMINSRLKKNRPNHLPDFVDRGKCLFFHPVNPYKCGIGRCFYRVDYRLLDLEKLYVASYEDAQEVYEENHEHYINRYWESLNPFSPEECHTYGYDKEVLYFGEIPFSKLEVGCSLRPTYRKLVQKLLARYTIESWSDGYRRVIISETESYEISFSLEDRLVVSSSNGSVDHEVFSFLENQFEYKEKRISYQGELRVVYTGVVVT